MRGEQRPSDPDPNPSPSPSPSPLTLTTHHSTSTLPLTPTPHPHPHQELEDKKNQGAGTRQAKTEWKERGDQQEMRRLGKAKSSRSAIHAHRDESKQIQAS